MSKTKTAVIFGVTGQDGSYLSELLLAKNYNVVGVTRRCSTDNTQRLAEANVLHNADFWIKEGELTDTSSLTDILKEYEPDEVYNLAAQSHVGTSFSQPAATWNINAIGTQNILEAIRRYKPDAKFYQASTSEMFGSVIDPDGFQRETTELSPNSPYAVAKVAAHHTVRLYREAYSLFACSGILFNHESERRGEKFVTRKITRYIAAYYNDLVKTKLKLGNLDAYRDWGHAQDYVRAMWLMLQADKPDDYVVATGEANSVRDFLTKAFACIGIKDWSNFVQIDPAFIRPYEVPMLKGDASKARTKLNWKNEIQFEELVGRMINSDIKKLKNEQVYRG